MEVASGDYGSDLTKQMSIGVEKLYGDRCNKSIIIEDRVAVTDGKIFVTL